MNRTDIEEEAMDIEEKIVENEINICKQVNCGSSKIKKTKFDPDISYRAMQGKVRQEEKKYEVVQKNLAALQMQYEAVSMKYHETLRLRSVTLDKVAEVKAMIDVFEQNISNTVDTLNQTQSELRSILHAYTSLSCSVKELLEKYLRLME